MRSHHEERHHEVGSSSNSRFIKLQDRQEDHRRGDPGDPGATNLEGVVIKEQEQEKEKEGSEED